jgi:hypothetical protein
MKHSTKSAQLEQEAAQGINTTNGYNIDDHANPIEDVMELGETCKIQQKENGTASGFMSKISSLCARSTKTVDLPVSDYIAGGSGTTSDTADISKFEWKTTHQFPVCPLQMAKGCARCGGACFMEILPYLRILPVAMNRTTNMT